MGNAMTIKEAQEAMVELGYDAEMSNKLVQEYARRKQVIYPVELDMGDVVALSFICDITLSNAAVPPPAKGAKK